MWAHPLTRDPRATRYRGEIEQYLRRRARILRSKKKTAEKLGLSLEAIDSATPVLEPISRGSWSDTKLWTLLVRAFHPMPFMGGAGRYIRFFIRDMNDGRMLGCASLGSAVLSCAARDRWIGWTMQQRLRNLRKVANNRRFLILPNVRVRNLASRVLALLCDMGQKEWESRYGDPLALVETFVEPGYPGTSYRAAGWMRIGETQGFTHITLRISALADKKTSVYLYTGQKKSIFVRPLSRFWAAELMK